MNELYKAKLDMELLIGCIEPIISVTDSAILNITENGISVKCVDIARVSLVDMQLNHSAFDEFKLSAHELKKCIVFSNLLEMIKLWGTKKVELEITENNLRVKSGIFDYSILLHGLDHHCSKETKMSKLNSDITIDVKIGMFKRSIYAFGLLSNEVIIGTTGKEVFLSAESDEDANKLRIPIGETDKNSNFEVRYSLDYLLDLCKGITTAKEVTLSFSKDEPLKIDFDIMDDKGKVSYFLAPKLL